MTNPDSNVGLSALLEHLVELRDRLLKIVIAIGVVFLILTPFVQDLYNWLSDPLIRQLPEGSKLIAIGVATPFIIPFKLGLLVAFLVTLPFTFYQIWGFIAPGLYQHEKRLVTPLLVSSVSLFYVGIAFAYFVVIPMIARAAVAFAPSNVNPTPDIASYLDFTIAMFLAFGLSFETPVATIILIGMGIVSVEALNKARPYIIVGAFVIAMFLTPPDVVSQILMAVPIWLLFEAGLALSKVFSQHIERFRNARTHFEAEQEAQEQAHYATANTASSTLWEDEQHLVEEVSFKDKPKTTDEFTPLTDAEMDAELKRIEAEQAKLDAEHQARQRDNDPTPPTLDK